MVLASRISGSVSHWTSKFFSYAVLAFQMGDAFTNSVTPASGTTMTILSIAGIPLRRWWKFAIPMLGIWWIVAFVVLFYATAVQIGPF